MTKIAVGSGVAASRCSASRRARRGGARGERVGRRGEWCRRPWAAVLRVGCGWRGAEPAAPCGAAGAPAASVTAGGSSVISSLSASTVSVPSRTALRTSVSHGLPGALNACWKFSATGVSPLPATSLIVTRRGSFVGVLVAREVRARDDVVVLREHLDLRVLRHHPAEEVPRLRGLLGVLRDADAVAADEGRCAALGPGMPATPDVERGRREQGRGVEHEADVALGEAGGPGRAGLVLRARQHGAGLPQVVPGGVDLLGGVAGEQRLGAVVAHAPLRRRPTRSGTR